MGDYAGEEERGGTNAETVPYLFFALGNEESIALLFRPASLPIILEVSLKERSGMSGEAVELEERVANVERAAYLVVNLSTYIISFHSS